jgi:ABC-type transport system substrate-binding protein
MASVEAPDDATVVLTLKSRDASFLATIANITCSIIPKEVVEENGRSFSGCRRQRSSSNSSSTSPNTRVTLEKNPTSGKRGGRTPTVWNC